MDERKRNVAVGLTTAIGLVGLLVLMLLFGDFTGLLDRTYPVTIRLPTAGGLHTGSRVQLSGIDIGQVDAVRLHAPAGNGVEVIARIHDDVRIPEDAVAYIETPLLAGSPVIAMRVPDEAQPPYDYLPRDGSARIQGQAPTIASAFAQEMQAVLDEPMEKLDVVIAEFEALSQEWQLVGRNINQLVEPRDAADVGLDGEGANLATVLARTDRRLAELEDVLAGIDRYTGDDELFDDVKQTIANSRAVSEQASETMEQLTGSVNENITLLRRRYVALADDMAGAVGSMRELVDEAREGEGTLGRLVKDPELYENLNDASERLQTTLDEMRLLIERWQAEGLPVSF